MQDDHPLAYLSKSLGPKYQGLSTYEKEYMTILLIVQSWHSYLQFQEFVILTDQKSLTQLSDQRLHTTWQQEVFSKLMGLQYRIVYRKGTKNRATDALSRHPTPPAICAAVSTLIPSWISSVIATYDSDPFARDLIAKLTLNAEVVPYYSLNSGVLRYRNRIWVGNEAKLQHHIMTEFHNSA
jgi:hypothetical protein